MGSMARRIARKDVVPESVKREWYDKGVHAGVASMLEHTEKQLSDAYGQGFTEGKIKSQLATAVAAVVVLHDKFGFGKCLILTILMICRKRIGRCGTNWKCHIPLLERKRNEILGCGWRQSSCFVLYPGGALPGVSREELNN